MVKCIFCAQEIPDDKIKEHIAEKHLGVHFTNGAAPALDPQPQNSEIPKSVNNEITKSQNNKISEEKQKPKKRYLNPEEILTLLQNTNKRFPTKEIPGCPITKENE
jgi:hypothetical protein